MKYAIINKNGVVIPKRCTIKKYEKKTNGEYEGLVVKYLDGTTNTYETESEERIQEIMQRQHATFINNAEIKISNATKSSFKFLRGSIELQALAIIAGVFGAVFNGILPLAIIICGISEISAITTFVVATKKRDYAKELEKHVLYSKNEEEFEGYSSMKENEAEILGTPCKAEGINLNNINKKNLEEMKKQLLEIKRYSMVEGGSCFGRARQKRI